APRGTRSWSRSVTPATVHPSAGCTPRCDPAGQTGRVTFVLFVTPSARRSAPPGLLTSLEPAGLSTGTTRPCVASPCGWFTQASGRGNDDRRLPEVADLQLRHPAVLVVPDDALVREVGQVRAQTVEV